VNDRELECSVVYLVGAGPGDPELITVKGLDLLEHCDVLLYDSLVPAEIVDRCRAPEQIYVGKTSGGHALGQDEITALLIELAAAPGPPRSIVRLKGGDPYVFGRGGEEALACVAAGVHVEVVPGVTSGVAAAAYAGVPVTHRSISRGVTFITGHAAKGGVPDLPWAELAGSGLTLVFYMGVGTLPTIVEQLTGHGLDPATPAMTVQEGTLPGQRQVVATVATLVERVKETGIRPPSVTVIGDVVGLGAQIGAQQQRSLAGRTVVIVRAEERHYPEMQRLREAGARVVDVPGIRCVPRDGDADVEQMFAALQPQDAVAFTSALAVHYFGAQWRALPESARTPPPLFISASPAFVEAMDREEIPAAVAPEEMGVGNALRAMQDAGIERGTTVWLPRAAAADQELPSRLDEAGYQARPVVIYDTVPVPLSRDVESMLHEGRVDAVLFLSGTCVRSVVEAVPEIGGQTRSDLLIAAIGRKTAAVVNECGLSQPLVPAKPSLAALVDAVIAELSLAPALGLPDRHTDG
jgi:uroporphyrinogen III methyltransferase / synthase